VPAALPAAALAQLERDPGTRVLWLRPESDIRVSYVLSSPSGPSFGDAELPRLPVATRVLDRVVADLAVPRGSNAAEALATFAVKYVAVPDPVPPALAQGLDAQAGLARVNFQGDVRVWRTLTPAARLTVVPAPIAAPAREGTVATRDQLRLNPPVPVRPVAADLASRTEATDGVVPGGPAGRVLALSQRAHEGWEATLDGVPLKRVTLWGWAQGFELPETGGTLHVRHDNAPRRAALTAQGVLLLVALVLAAPPVRRGDDEPEPEPEPEDERDDELAGVGAGPDTTAEPRNVRTL
jgi:hypothetical protein